MKTLVVFLSVFSAALAAQAKVVTKLVPYEQAGVKLEGFLAYDDEKTAQGKLPGVLVVHEWWGLNDYTKHRAVMLAELGYVAFAVDMYGGGTSTTDPTKAGELSGQFYGKPLMAERARAGLDQLLATGLVDDTKVAAIGYCFGGAVCQVLAYSGAPLAGIVSFHGSLVPAPAGASNKAKFLICHGALDPFSKLEAIAAFKKSMDDGGFDYQFISYAGALHAFTNPDATELGRKYGLPIAYNAAADRRSWQHMRIFFDELFGCTCSSKSCSAAQNSPTK
jgi:dienelactone hydrolase